MSKGQVKLNVQELKDFGNHIIQNNRVLQNAGKKPASIEIIGEAGLGKTSIVQEIAEDNNLAFVKLNLAQIEELGDLVGFPIRQFQMCKTADDCTWVDEHAISTYEKEGFSFTGKKRMSYCPPEWIADKTSGGILLLDDWTRADVRFVQACMELIDRQEYISWKLPKDWHIFLTSNPSGGDYLVNEIDDAQRTRYISVELMFNVQDWAKWAEGEGIDGRCINFMLLNPEVVNKTVNPRSLVTFFNGISSIKDFDSNLAKINMIGEGSIGPSTTGMFVSFINNKLDKLVSPEYMMTKDFDVVKEKVQSLVGSANLGTYRADIASTLCTRVLNHSLLKAKDNPIDKEYLDRIENIVMEDFFGSDLNYHLIKSLFSGSQKFKQITMRQKLTKYVIS